MAKNESLETRLKRLRLFGLLARVDQIRKEPWLPTVLDIEDDLPGEDEHSFHTLGGFIMHVLGRIPTPTDHFEALGWRFEVMDMDRNRVDKVLLSRSSEI